MEEVSFKAVNVYYIKYIQGKSSGKSSKVHVRYFKTESDAKLYVEKFLDTDNFEVSEIRKTNAFTFDDGETINFLNTSYEFTSP